MESYEKLIDILVFCVVGFLLPAIFLKGMVNECQMLAAKLCVREFTEEAAVKGYIDRTMYEELLGRLADSDSQVYPELIIERDLLAPEYVIRTISDTEEDLEAGFTGNNILQQKEVSTELPLVIDPGSPKEGGLTGNVAGADTTVAGPSAQHQHSGACFSGMQHYHSDACRKKETACTAGCVQHMHTGDSRYGTGCYQGGRYYPGSRYDCGSFSVTGYGGSIEVECGICGNRYSITAVYMTCNSCGYSVSYSRGQCSCSPYDDSSSYTHEKITQGYYTLNCGKTSGSYYDSVGELCSECSGDGKAEALACTKTEGYYYDESGVACIPLCNRIVILLVPLWKEQIVGKGDTPDTRVKALFADGHSEIVNGTVSGFDSTDCNRVQTVTVSYGEYVGSLSNPGKMDTVMKIMVMFPRQSCNNGHMYYLINGNTTSCPYCKEYPKKLSIQGIAGEPVRISKGTTLSENGISLKVTYYDNHTEIVTGGWVDNLDENYAGEQLVTIGYKGVVVTVPVYNERRKVLCPVCRYSYFLYPDDTNPGCPKCLSEIPVFTGNVLQYKETISEEEILDAIYLGEGVWRFAYGDMFGVTIFDTKAKRTVVDIYRMRVRNG